MRNCIRANFFTADYFHRRGRRVSQSLKINAAAQLKNRRFFNSAKLCVLCGENLRCGEKSLQGLWFFYPIDKNIICRAFQGQPANSQ